MLVLSVIYFSIQLVGILLVFEKDKKTDEETINEVNINESEESSQILTEKTIEENSLGVK
jgi:hypothetical protein